MTPDQNKQYNEYFEKHCRYHGGQKCIALENLKPVRYTTPLIPENKKAPQHLNEVTKAIRQRKYYLINDIEIATLVQLGAAQYDARAIATHMELLKKSMKQWGH